MRRLQSDLLSLVADHEITEKDAAVILLVRDGLKPGSSVGVAQSTRLRTVLESHHIPYMLTDGRIHIGAISAGYQETPTHIPEGANFGFPRCCSSVFFNPIAWFFSKNSRSSFSGLSAYIFHIPCSTTCHETRSLAMKYMSHLKEHYPAMAETLEHGTLVEA